jgi:NAD(P)-dependent dehydrogenase (short-subunit alcohol dehydrogenase family)
MELRGRNALLTGAAGGLGHYIGRSLAAEGVNLALCDLPAVSVDDLLDELRPRGIQVEAVPADLTDTAGL